MAACVLIAVGLMLQADDLAAGNSALAAHDYAAASEKFRAVAENSTEDPVAFEALQRLGAAERLQGHWEEVGQALTRAVPVVIRLHGDTSLELASVLSDLSGAQRASGDLKKALLSIESAIRIREIYPGEQLPRLSNDLLSAAEIEIELADKRFARKLLEQAMAVNEKAFAPESPDSLRVLDELAGLFRGASEYEQAEPLYSRALRIREAAYGPRSAELLATLDSLAYVYFGLQRYSDAQPVYERLLALWEANAGADHPMVALTLDKMAEFFAAQGRYAEAAPLAARAIDIRNKSLLDSVDRATRIRKAQQKAEDSAGEKP